MEQHLLTDVYGLISLLLIVGGLVRWFRRQSKRTSTKAQALAGGTPPPLWKRGVRKTLTLTAGAFVFIVGMAIVMILCLGYYARQAKAERDKVHIGMTVDQVLPLVHGALGIRTQLRRHLGVELRGRHRRLP